MTIKVSELEDSPNSLLSMAKVKMHTIQKSMIAREYVFHYNRGLSSQFLVEQEMKHSRLELMELFHSFPGLDKTSNFKDYFTNGVTSTILTPQHPDAAFFAQIFLGFRPSPEVPNADTK